MIDNEMSKSRKPILPYSNSSNGHHSSRNSTYMQDNIHLTKTAMWHRQTAFGCKIEAPAFSFDNYIKQIIEEQHQPTHSQNSSRNKLLEKNNSLIGTVTIRPTTGSNAKSRKETRVSSKSNQIPSHYFINEWNSKLKCNRINQLQYPYRGYHRKTNEFNILKTKSLGKLITDRKLHGSKKYIDIERLMLLKKMKLNNPVGRSANHRELRNVINNLQAKKPIFSNCFIQEKLRTQILSIGIFIEYIYLL